MSYFRVTWERASFEKVRAALTAMPDIEPQAGDRDGYWIAFEAFIQRPTSGKIAKVKRKIQDAIWELNDGCQVTVDELTVDQFEEFL